MKCEQCGKVVSVRSKFCPNCGSADLSDALQPKTAPTNSSNQSNQTAQRGNKPDAAEGKGGFKTILMLALVVIAIIFIVKQCNANKLQGTWVADDGSSITFSDSKNGYITVNSTMSSDQTLNFTYFIDDDEVELKTENTLFSYSKTIRYKFQISGNTLTLEEVDTGKVETFRKQS